MNKRNKKLQQTFFELLDRHQASNKQKEDYWQQVDSAYNEAARHYHTFDHLSHIYEELLVVRHLITDWDSILFATFYHDVVYDTGSVLNEDDSAGVAEHVMLSIGNDEKQILLVRDHILATKTHNLSQHTDTLFFIDADLSILGANEISYDLYARQIRKEYVRYPDDLYYTGRKRVLLHFLAMHRIFKTDAFYQKYEIAARHNLSRELKVLDKNHLR